MHSTTIKIIDFQWDSRCFLRADWRTYITKLTVAFRAAGRVHVVTLSPLLSPGSPWGHLSATQHGLLIQRHHTDRLSIICIAMQLALMRSCSMKCTCQAVTVSCHIRLGSRLTNFNYYLLCWDMASQLFLPSPFPIPDSLIVLLL